MALAGRAPAGQGQVPEFRQFLYFLLYIVKVGCSLRGTSRKEAAAADSEGGGGKAILWAELAKKSCIAMATIVNNVSELNTQTSAFRSGYEFSKTMPGVIGCTNGVGHIKKSVAAEAAVQGQIIRDWGNSFFEMIIETGTEFVFFHGKDAGVRMHSNGQVTQMSGDVYGDRFVVDSQSNMVKFIFHGNHKVSQKVYNGYANIYECAIASWKPKVLVARAREGAAFYKVANMIFTPFASDGTFVQPAEPFQFECERVVATGEIRERRYKDGTKVPKGPRMQAFLYHHDGAPFTVADASSLNIAHN